MTTTKGRRPMPLTAKRRDTFLRVLRETGGCFTAAAEAASPKSQAKRVRGYTSFRGFMERDLEFAAEVHAVMEQCSQDIEREMHRRSMVGIEEPVYQAGKRVQDIDPETGEQVPATVRKYSDQILLARARALMPERYGDRKTVDVVHSGKVRHVPLTMEDLRGLSPAELEKVEEAFSILQRAQQPEAIEYQPEPTARIIEAEYETVE